MSHFRQRSTFDYIDSAYAAAYAHGLFLVIFEKFSKVLRLRRLLSDKNIVPEVCSEVLRRNLGSFDLFLAEIDFHLPSFCVCRHVR